VEPSYSKPIEEPDALHWNVRPGHPAAGHFQMSTDAHVSADLRYDAHGATMLLNGRLLGRLEGGVARLVTDKKGKATILVGISETAQTITLKLAGQASRSVWLHATDRAIL
jgi:hypothetical protein